MSEMACLHCRATTSNGLALCELCQRKAATDLEFLPIYFRNLARWRPGRAGSRPVPGSRVLYDGEVQTQAPDRVSRALDEVGNALSTWARALADDRPMLAIPQGDDEATTATATCLLLGQNLTSIATLEWAGVFVSETAKHEANLSRLTMAVVPGWYAGGCQRRVTMDAPCGAPTYVVPGLTWVQCGTCGTTTYARDHLETILTEARGWVARPMRMAEAIVALVDTEQSVPRLHKRIVKWGDRDRIATIRASNYAPKKYRLGEVLDRLFAEGQTRQEPESVTRAS